MSETTATGAPVRPTRPTFLTVLCILSFIGCAWYAFSGITGYFTLKAMAPASSAASQELSSAFDDAINNEGMSDAEREMASALGGALGGLTDFGAMANSSLAQGLLCLVILIGVWMMWNLKKTGFYIYTVGQLGYVIVPFLLVGGLAGGLMGILGAVFPVLFIILYAVNLKHMS
ncbi:MAG: hypothetical protein IPM46_15230 [Flavobacteriales bacterium]|nr:hypothetical protein [Flavobacteriales bacterium]